MEGKLFFVIFLLGCVVVIVTAQSNGAHCGKNNQPPCDEGLECLPPGNCNNPNCQHKCYECDCYDPVQCKVEGSGNNEQVVCDCTVGNSPGSYGPTCEDECENANHCGTNEICSDGDCVCPAGYEVVEGNCQDIDECAGEVTPCSSDEGANCVNNEGGYTCVCPGDGYWDGTACQSDEDECALGTDNCDDENAVCTNTDGSFDCTCNAGYNGDGVTCTDINECGMNNGNCGSDALCINTAGSFSCRCSQGYYWDTDCSRCKDTNECDTNNGGCGANAYCVNTEGSRVCMCHTGFNWNGLFCDPKPKDCCCH